MKFAKLAGMIQMYKDTKLVRPLTDDCARQQKGHLFLSPLGIENWRG